MKVGGSSPTRRGGKPRDTREHARIFSRRSSSRGGAQAGLTFSTSQMALPLVTDDKALSANLDRARAELLTKALPTTTKLSHASRGGLLDAEIAAAIRSVELESRRGSK